MEAVINKKQATDLFLNKSVIPHCASLLGQQDNHLNLRIKSGNIFFLSESTLTLGLGVERLVSMQVVWSSNLIEGSFFHQILVKRMISMMVFALFFIANNSKFINCTYFGYTNNNKKKKKDEKGFFLWWDSNLRQVREQNG